MATDKVIGGPLSSEVINQLQIRSDVYSKPTRGDQDLEYISARTGWVKFTSGVNVGGEDTLAKKYILIAGTAGRFGTDTYSNFPGADGKGFRPMPGITGVQIRSINRFGVLKEATITFNCWDVSQLQELELLFMRPGFTALLEWGHSVYYQSADNFVRTPSTVGSFFTPGTSKEDIYREIEKLKKNSGQNYDAILGFVKNFSWSFRPDGGYDCTTSLISIGEIIESLTVDLDVAAITEDKSPAATGKEVKPPTMLENVFRVIKKYGVTNGWSKIKEFYPDFASKFAEVNGVDGIDYIKHSGVSYKDAPDSTAGDRKDFTYIPLKAYCQLVNTILLVDNNKKNLIKLNTKIAPLSSEPNPDNIPTCKFRNFKYQISTDPAICQIITPSVDTWYKSSSDGLKFKQKTLLMKEGSSDEILNIWMNIDFLADTVTQLRSEPKDKRTLNNLFQPLFEQLNQVLGGINDINFYYDESAMTYYIVDRQVQAEKSDISTLYVTGLKSTVSQFNFVTKLSPAVSTMAAISAQAGGADVGLEAEALLRWNEGLTDRIITKKASKTNDAQKDETAILAERVKAQQQRLDTVTKALDSFWNSNQYIKAEFDSARTNFNQYATTYIQFYDDEGESSTGNAGPAGIIPFEVNLTMDGISGVKIGQVFEINKGVMPDKYYGVIGFIVTGIDHDIQNNRWVTNIKAQTLVIKNKVKGSGPVNANGNQNADGTSRTEYRGIGSVSKTIKEVYIPTLEKVVPAGSKGIKLLITAQTQMEGFAPGTKSYRTNNPGNIGNTDNGGTRGFSSLDTGVKGQYEYAVGVALNQNKNYKIGQRKQAPSVYDKDSGQSYPGIDFTYTGTLDQYLKIYSTGARSSNTYLNLVVSYFKKNGYTITGNTTLKEIHDIV